METVHEILHLDTALADLAQRRAAAKQSSERAALDSEYQAADEAREELLALLTPEDLEWLEIERAYRRHGLVDDDDD